MMNRFGLLCIVMLPSLLSAQTPNSDLRIENANKWTTTGFSEDGVHTNAEGQMKLGKVTASAVEEFFEFKAKTP
jgi:hypothetical protein